MKKLALLENIIIITCASSGIGRHLALRLSEQGAWLALAARNAEQLEEVSQQCHQLGDKAIVIPTNVAD